MEPLKLNEYNDLLDNFLRKFIGDKFTWEDAAALMAIPSDDYLNWDQFFSEIANHRWNHQNEKKSMKIYTPGLHFPALSLTGDQCDLSCDHCDKKYLKGMRDASSSDKFDQQLTNIVNKGGIGALLSGGCDSTGQVPVVKFSKEIAEFKSKHDFYFNSHLGIIDPKTAKDIAKSGVDMVSFDLIFDDSVIKNMFHLSHTSEDYKESYRILKAADIRVVPHVLIGANFGKIISEVHTLQFIQENPSDLIIFIVMIPPKVGKEVDSRFRIVSPSEVARLIFIAKALIPDMELSLGCMRMRGKSFITLEKWSILAGINRMEIPSRSTMNWLQEYNYDIEHFGACCGIPTSFEKTARAMNISGKIEPKRENS
jgi:hypothetical protein